jgi:NAD(P)-dependent dehydrogenase (short-subunit alcohol dehydrogenase family)
MSSTWLITGCSTGLGRAFAAEVLGRGQNAVVTARNPLRFGTWLTLIPKLPWA